MGIKWYIWSCVLRAILEWRNNGWGVQGEEYKIIETSPDFDPVFLMNIDIFKLVVDYQCIYVYVYV